MVVDMHDLLVLYTIGREKGSTVNARRNMHLPQRVVSTLVNLKLTIGNQRVHNARVGALCHYYNRYIGSQRCQSMPHLHVSNIFFSHKRKKKQETRNKGGVQACIFALIRITRQTSLYIQNSGQESIDLLALLSTKWVGKEEHC